MKPNMTCGSLLQLDFHIWIRLGNFKIYSFHAPSLLWHHLSPGEPNWWEGKKCRTLIRTWLLASSPTPLGCFQRIPTMEFSCHKHILYVMNLFYMCGPNVGPRVRWLLVPWHFCSCGATLTPLAEYARSLKTQPTEDVLPMHFPMYTVALHTLLGMSKVETHEQLKAQDLLVEFRKKHGTGSIPITRVAWHWAPWRGVQADESLAGCSEAHDGQLAQHTSGSCVGRLWRGCQTLAHI